MESHALTGLFPPIAYSFNGKTAPVLPSLQHIGPGGGSSQTLSDLGSTLGVVSFPRDLTTARAWLAWLEQPQAGRLLAMSP